MKPGAAAALVLVLAGALLLRLPALDQRPLHTDEAVHALKFKGLWEAGSYRYDPDEYHGPALYYATLPVAWARGGGTFAELTEPTLRAVPVLFGAALIPLLLLVRDGQGRTATLWAALFVAVSPAMVFYSRYYIHEMLLVTFTFVLMASLWRYTRSRRAIWAVLGGAAAGLMDATKETCVFALAALGAALVIAQLWERRLGRGDGFLPRVNRRHLALALAVAVGVAVLFLSSFLSNPAGPLDAVRTYLPWLERAQGQSPHVHPWHYYFDLLVWHRVGRGPTWTEALILGLASVGLGAAFRRGQVPWGDAAWVRFVGAYTLILTAIYCAIPYKTPWCALGFLHGAILLAGAGAAAVLEWAGRGLPRALVLAGLVAGTGHLAVQAWRAGHPYAESQRNPYVYAQTLTSALDLVERVDALARHDAAGRNLVVKVMAQGGDYWPLPWYLRRFPRAGWWAEVPPDPAAPIIIASPRFEPELEEKLGASHVLAGHYGLRPAVFLQLYVEHGLWESFLRDRSAPKADAAPAGAAAQRSP